MNIENGKKSLGYSECLLAREKSQEIMRSHLTSHQSPSCLKNFCTSYNHSLFASNVLFSYFHSLNKITSCLFMQGIACACISINCVSRGERALSVWLRTHWTQHLLRGSGRPQFGHIFCYSPPSLPPSLPDLVTFCIFHRFRGGAGTQRITFCCLFASFDACLALI